MSPVVLHSGTSTWTKALEMFDKLVGQGRLFYEPTEGELMEHDGFKVSW
jgi:hypothetical protein